MIYSNSDDRDSEEYREWKQAVFDRDGKKCQMPGCRRRRRLECHHIQRWADAPYLRWEPDNGIILCKQCHYELRNNEIIYLPLFMEIVEENKKKCT